MKKVSVTSLVEAKRAGRKIACLTAYDASFAALMDAAGVDVLLVGDSLGMVLHGAGTTLQVTVGDIVYHSRQVSRGARRALVAADMPFMSYATPAQALGNAARMLAEGGVELVKLEGGAWLADTVRLLTERGVPVWAHLGLMPQSIHKLGGYKVQGRDAQEAEQMLADARVLEEAGAAMLLLECVPAVLARRITAAAGIPVIGIGAGPDCDGQILVVYDALGISGKYPSFSKNFLAGRDSIGAAVEAYVADVQSGRFPETPPGAPPSG